MGEKVSVDKFILCVFSFKVIAIRPLVFVLSEMKVCKLLQDSKGYRMGQPGKRDVNRTHSLLVDHLKVYQESHKTLKDVNEMIVKANNDTGACYGVVKWA